MTIDGMLRFISVVGSLASVVVAIVAVVIAIQIAKHAERADAYIALHARTLEVHRTYRHLDAIQELSELAHRILHEVPARKPWPKGSSYLRTMSEVYHEFTKDDLQSIRSSVSIFLTMARVLHTCGWTSTSSGHTDCSKELLFATGFDDMSWMYFGILPAIYCDDVMRERLGIDGSDIPEKSELFRLETMIIDYLKWDYHEKGAPEVQVFRTLEDRGQNRGIAVRPNIEELCGKA